MGFHTIKSNTINSEGNRVYNFKKVVLKSFRFLSNDKTPTNIHSMSGFLSYYMIYNEKINYQHSRQIVMHQMKIKLKRAYNSGM